MATGLVFDKAYLEHETGPFHPETPARLDAVIERLDSSGLDLVRIEPREAEEEHMSLVHSSRYIEHVRDVCSLSPACLDSADTSVSPGSYRAALLAAGGMLAAVDAVAGGEVENAFCAVRPPGHHATREMAMGFCLFNSVAIGARYAQSKHSLAKVLIIDWDVHHGNGTQDAFYEDGTVLYFSVHRHPFYPGSGSASERGKGEGEGLTVNCPLSAGCGDDEFVRAFEDILVPAADEFGPDIVLLSAGFDAYEGDPLGGMTLTVDGYGLLTRIVKGIAEKHCSGRLVSILEGGYDIAGLADCVERHINEL